MNSGINEKRTVIAFGRGLFVLRYAGDDGAQFPPRVYFAVSSGAATIVSAPGLPAGELAAVGDLAVIAAESAGSLDVLVREFRPGSGVACRVALDQLGPSRALSGEGQAFPELVSGGTRGADQHGLIQHARFGRPSGGRAEAAGDHLVAHLSRRGDVAVALGDWIGGPQEPTPIEGLAFPSGIGAGTDLHYQVLAIGSNEWSDWVRPGAFAGSRGAARPLRGVRLRLPTSSAWTLRAEALFLGAAIEARSGHFIEFVSGSPFDAMVGLRIELVGDVAQVIAPPPLAASAAAAGRLKVFRSSRA